MPRARPVLSPAYLGIEGGGTRSTARLEAADGTVLAAFMAGPAVLSLMSDRELLWLLRHIAGRLPQGPAAVGIGLAGARTAADAQRLRRAAGRVWPGLPCAATNDLETALAAAPERPGMVARVLVLSGTGSCCFGRAADGRTAKVGGRGHLIGDRASACDISLRALRAVLADFDHRGRMGALGAALLNALMFNEPEQLIPWSLQASKTEIGRLATTVFAAAAGGDKLARRLLAESALMLAEDAGACAGQLARPGEALQFVFNGGVLLKNPSFLGAVQRRLRARFPKAWMTPLEVPSVCGAVALARQLPLKVNPAPAHSPVRQSFASLALPAALADLRMLAASPTEQRNPRTMELDKLPLELAVELMLMEDTVLVPMLQKERKVVAAVARRVAAAFTSGGRLFYVGAGTSGRLGVLDASEIPPTFRAPREQVQGIIAGGRQALWSAVEGAEDDAPAGAAAVALRGAGKKDVVVGIAASGRTPFVWGALHEAKRRGAFTVLLCFNPGVKAALRRVRDAAWKPDCVIAPDLGPEILTGSTRLKAGTATKLVLNMITTLAMVRCGKVISNLMVDLNPSNVKLRDRAVRMVAELTGAAPEQAEAALKATGWVVKAAYRRLGGR